MWGGNYAGQLYPGGEALVNTTSTAYTKSFSETITISEVFAKAHGFIKTFSESALTLSETLKRASTRILLETITLSEVFSKSWNRLKSFSDTIDRKSTRLNSSHDNIS